MLKIRVENTGFVVGMTSRLDDVKFFITKTVEIPSWQLFIFKNKQLEDPKFNVHLRNEIAKVVSAPYILGPVNTAIRTRGCKACGKFTLHFYADHFPTKDKFEMMRKEVAKVLTTLSKMAE